MLVANRRLVFRKVRNIFTWCVFRLRRRLMVMMTEIQCESTGFQCPSSLGTSGSQQTRGLDPPVAPVSGWTCTAAAKVS